MFFGAVGEKAEMTDTLDAVGEHVEEKAADELFGIEGHRFQPVVVSLRAKSGFDLIFWTPFSDPIFILTVSAPAAGLGFSLQGLESHTSPPFVVCLCFTK